MDGSPNRTFRSTKLTPDPQRRLRSAGRQELCHLRPSPGGAGLVNSSVAAWLSRVGPYPDLSGRLAMPKAARHQPGRGSR